MKDVIILVFDCSLVRLKENLCNANMEGQDQANQDDETMNAGAVDGSSESS